MATLISCCGVAFAGLIAGVDGRSVRDWTDGKTKNKMATYLCGEQETGVPRYSARNFAPVKGKHQNTRKAPFSLKRYSLIMHARADLPA